MHEEAPALFSHESINKFVLKAKAFDLSWTEVDERVMPNPMSTPKGCPFSTRCPVVMESYRTEKPNSGLLARTLCPLASDCRL